MVRRAPVSTETRTYTAIYEWSPETGVYVVTFPAFPNLATQGETRKEARAMAAECLEVHLEGLQEAGLPIPDGEGHSPASIREAVRVAVKTA
ncbi:MAG: type II toxin-antitoxin system HicB family antitoxin [Pseudomonadota bacterium]